MGPVSGSVRATPERVLEYSTFLESMGHAFDCISNPYKMCLSSCLNQTGSHRRWQSIGLTKQDDMQGGNPRAKTK